MYSSTHYFLLSGRKYDQNGEEIDPANHKVHTWSNSSIKSFEKTGKVPSRAVFKVQSFGENST